MLSIAIQGEMTAVADASTHSRISLLVRRQGRVQRFRGQVASERFAQYASERAKRRAFADAFLPREGIKDVVPPVQEPAPLDFEGREGLAARARLWGLHPVWGPYFKGLVWFVSHALDLLTFFQAQTKSRVLYRNSYPLLAYMFLIAGAVLYYGLDFILAGSNFLMLPFMEGFFLFSLHWVIPFCWSIAAVLLFAGIRQGLGCSGYVEYFKPYYAPIPAYEGRPVFFIGDVILTLKDCHTNIISFGGIGSGKTAGLINPLILQFFRKLNNPDPFSEDAVWSGLVLDVKGDFIDYIQYCFRLVNRPMTDLVIIDPGIDLVQYNPLDASDPSKMAERGAAKLAAVQRIMGGGNSKDEYWNNTSKSVIQTVLEVLRIIKNPTSISLADVGRYARDDDRISSLIKEAEERLDRDRFQLSEEEYNGFKDAVTKLRTEWAALNENTKSIL